MGKIIKLCVVAILFLFVTPWHAYAQSTYPDSIVVNDLLGEARLAEKTKYLMKISLIGNSNDTVHKVIYYLTPNTFDVSINQIKEALSSQNIELDMMNMSDAKVDSEIKEYQTNLGLLSKQLISVNIPLMNPDEVPIIAESGAELSNVTELAELPSIVDGEVIVSITFKDENDTALQTEHFLVLYDHNTDLLKMASDKFKEKFPEYSFNLDNAYQSRELSVQPEIIVTNLGEINAFSMEMTVPVKSNKQSTKESTKESSSNSIVSVKKSESSEEKSVESIEKTTEASNGQRQSSYDKTNKTNESVKEDNKKILPSTGEIATNNIIKIAGVMLTLGILLFGITIVKKCRK